MTTVLSLGVLPTGEGPAHALLALGPDGPRIATARSWAEAADQLALTGPVDCEPGLTLLGRSRGWVVRAPAQDALSHRATVCLGLALGVPPTWRDALEDLVEAWCAFWPLGLWEELPSELALPLLRRTGTTQAQHAISVLGQGGEEFGVAFYFDREDFERMWAGKNPRNRAASVLASDELEFAFAPLGVPTPVMSVMAGMRPVAPTLDDLRLVTGAMGVLMGKPEVSLGRDDRLALEPPTPAQPSEPARPRAVKQRAKPTKTRAKPTKTHAKPMKKPAKPKSASAPKRRS